MCHIISIPVDVLRQIIPDLDTAVELGATCKSLRNMIPRDLFSLGKHTYALIDFAGGSVSSCCANCIILLDEVDEFLYVRRVAYLRYIVLHGTVYYLRAIFKGNPAGIEMEQGRLKRHRDSILLLDNSIKMRSHDAWVLTELADRFVDRTMLFSKLQLNKKPKDPSRTSLIMEVCLFACAAVCILSYDRVCSIVGCARNWCRAIMRRYQMTACDLKGWLMLKFMNGVIRAVVMGGTFMVGLAPVCLRRICDA